MNGCTTFSTLRRVAAAATDLAVRGRVAGVPAGGPAEEVTTTLGPYAERAGLDRRALVKIDMEGHDHAVLRCCGGTGALCLSAHFSCSICVNHCFSAVRAGRSRLTLRCPTRPMAA